MEEETESFYEIHPDDYTDKWAVTWKGRKILRHLNRETAERLVKDFNDTLRQMRLNEKRGKL